MKILRILTFGIVVTGAITALAEDKTGGKNNEPVFTIVKENKITCIKNQNRSGTCWDYAALSFFESEILHNNGKTYDLCEAFVANHDYYDRAVQVVRYHGDCDFGQGGSAYDVLYCLKHYGICPETAMPAAGSLYGDSLNNFNEFFSVLTPYVEAVARNKSKKLSNQWCVGLQAILDAYLGHCPEKFVYEGKEYTPITFRESLGLNLDDYVSFTSYTHHPFGTDFTIEVPNNWRHPLTRNVPLDELEKIIDNALMKGYTVSWGGDVSEDGFTRNGIAYFMNVKKTTSLTGSDMARWLKLEKSQQTATIDSLGCDIPELIPTQEQRQKRFDSRELTYDHRMHIFGIAKDQNGKEYYMVKNSWGETGKYKGIWYMTKNFILANTMDIMVNKKGL
ncbi:MAG: aminopeptidase [Prevotella sp.]|nr:aminopeptidase [Candidatus Equicola stercoris]